MLVRIRQKGPRIEVHRTGAGTCRIPFAGKIVDSAAAASLNKSMSFPLGDGGGCGPQLFLCGDGLTNAYKSDACIPWMVTTVIVPKEKEKTAEGEEEPPAKRTKATVKKGSVATHAVTFEDVSITVPGDEYHTEVVYVYKLPYLVDAESDTAKSVLNEQ